LKIGQNHLNFALVLRCAKGSVMDFMCEVVECDEFSLEKIDFIGGIDLKGGMWYIKLK